MNITVIFTGGTIGSSVQQDFVSTDAQMPYRLLAMYETEQEKKGAAIHRRHDRFVRTAGLCLYRCTNAISTAGNV